MFLSLFVYSQEGGAPAFGPRSFAGVGVPHSPVAGTV